MYTPSWGHTRPGFAPRYTQCPLYVTWSIAKNMSGYYTADMCTLKVLDILNMVSRQQGKSKARQPRTETNVHFCSVLRKMVEVKTAQDR